MKDRKTTDVLLPDERFMAYALLLALRGIGRVNPNPLVGALVVRDGVVVGEGWHETFGGPHAERRALADCAARGEDVRGATVYVTLEPCCHTGKTPPCADALVEAGVARVVVGTLDPNPLVAGAGCAQLRAAGIEVVEGVLAEECRRANGAFFEYIQTGRPLAVAKYAMTLDGKASTCAGASRWITGSAARRRVHIDRARYAAVMAGVGTVISDDPLLTCRVEDACLGDLADAFGLSALLPAAQGLSAVGGSLPSAPVSLRSPLRVVCDSGLRTPLAARIVETARETPTLIATCVADESRWEPYRRRGCEVVSVAPGGDGRVDLAELKGVLGARGLDSVIVEGGPRLLGAAFDARIVDAVQAYIAPKVFGGAAAPAPVGGAGVSLPADALKLARATVARYGDDVLVEGEVG